MYSERFGDALLFAHRVHQRQKRKTSGVPYVSHLLGVCSLVIDAGGSEEEAIAALLHDALEDQSCHYPGGRERLAVDTERRFGAEVLRIVEACTERAGKREGEDPRTQWRRHKLAYVERIAAADASVRRVSCADSLHNVRSLIRDHARMGEELWTRFRTRRRDDQLWAYDLIARTLVEAGTGPMAEELSRAVAELYRKTACSS